MKSIVLNNPQNLEILEAASPRSPSQGEALVRTRRVGICGTDLHAFQGNFPFMTYPRVLGHELSVEILELGHGGPGSSNLKIGDLCSVEPYLNCGSCLPCQIGKYNCCTNLDVIGVHSDGGMQECFNIPVSKLHVSNEIDLDHLAVAEMLAIGAHAISRSRELNGQKALVIGLGPIGLGVANFAILAGAEVLLLDIDRNRLEFAKGQFGLDGILLNKNIREELSDKFQGLPNVIFDATGNAESMKSTFELVSHSGEIVFVGLVRDQITFDNPNFHSHELTLKSSRNATAKDFKFVLKTLSDGRTDVTDWISHRVSPETLVQDLALWTDPSYGVIKGIVDFD